MSSVPPVGEAGPLGEVRARVEGGDITDDLVAVGRAVGVDHDDDVAGARLEPGDQGIPLALAALFDDLDGGPQLAGHVDGVVRGVAVHQDHFVYPVRKGLEDVRKVLRLVHGGYDHTHRWCYGQVRGDRSVLAGYGRILARSRRAQN